MKKSLLLMVMCLSFGSLATYAQDDDVYFVPSSKAEEDVKDSYTSSSSYEPIADDEAFSQSHWAEGRGNGKWDVDAYNRRGKNYKYRDEVVDKNVQSSTERASYDEGYEDGYTDGYFTSRLVRFCSPRVGIYVSSPFYMDYYDLCYYDPWYYGYGSPWSWSWSGWFGWGSWYGWRPYYSYWGWGGWYDPWWGGCYPHHHHWYPTDWYPSNARRGRLGGYIAYGGRRGSGVSTSTGGRGNYSGRPSGSLGIGGRNHRGNANFSGRPSRNFGTSGRPSRYNGSNGFDVNRPNRGNSNTARPSRSFNNRNNSDYNRPSQNRSNFNRPSRSSSFDRGSFGGGGRSGFGGGFGGGRSGGGRGRR